MRSLPVAVWLFALGVTAVYAQEGDTSQGKRAIPQEEALWSCTSQVERQSLNTERQKNQWLMHCLTGKAGSGPANRSVPAAQQAEVCRQQAAYLKLSGGEGENFVTACIKRNDDLLAKGQ